MKKIIIWELESIDDSIRCEFLSCENGNNIIRVHNRTEDCILEVEDEIDEGGCYPLYIALFGILKLWRTKEQELWKLLNNTAPIDQDQFFKDDVKALEDVIDSCIQSVRLIAF